MTEEVGSEMEKDTRSHKIKGQTVEKQLDQLEQQNAADKTYKSGSTNEIQTMATDEGVTQ